MLGKIAAGLIGTVGTAASGAYGIVSKTGKAIGEAGKALGSTAQNTKEPGAPSNNVVIANTGMAGSAGKQKVTGGGTLPALKEVAKPQVSTKMPTEELLNTVVKYLSSIDKSLKAQFDLDINSYQEQARAEREAIIENKPSTTFNDMKERLSGLKSDTKDNVSMAGTILKYAAILGGAAALIASTLGEKELNALKENVDEFKKKFSWLGDMASFIGIGGVAGFIFGGKGGRLKGGLVGIVASHVINRMYSLFTGGYKKDENGNVLIDQNGEPIKESRSMSATGYGLSAVAGIYAATRIAKRLPAAKLAAQTTGQLGRAAGSSSVAGIQAATRKGTSWLATRRGRKFLVILGRKLGKGVFAKIGKYLARIVAGLLATATGIGAIPGIIIILASVAFIGFDIFDVATSIYDAFKESGADDTTAAAIPAKTEEQDAAKVAGTTAANTQTPAPIEQDATKVAGTVASSNTQTQTPAASIGQDATKAGNTTAGYPTTSSTNGQNKTITGVVEGGAGYTTVTYSDGTIEKRGGTLPARTNNPGNIEYQDFAKSYGAVGSSPSTNGPPVAVFPTREAGFVAMDGLLKSKYSNGPIGKTIESWAEDPSHPAKVISAAGVDPNKKYTDFTKDEKVRFMRALAKVEGFYAAGSGPSIPSSSNSSLFSGNNSGTPDSKAVTDSSSYNSSSSGAMDLINSGAEQIGKIFGMIGSAVIKPGVARNFTPSGSNVSEQINTNSMNVQNDITFGIRNEKSKDTIASPTIPAGTPRGARPVKSVSNIDPNYQNINVLNKYLAHFRMAS